jgi:UDP-N-acetyl-D-glucosamine dehydrogenase
MVERDLSKRIKEKDVKLGVVGLGYVGLPLIIEFGKVGFDCIGVDTDENRVRDFNAGKSYISDIPSHILKDLREKGKIRATSSYSQLTEVGVIFICVPTPYTSAKAPDISYIIDAAERIAECIEKAPTPRIPKLIILQSTTYPGTTEEVVLPILEKRGLKCEEDFFLAFSPERIDPGNKKYTFSNTPKVVGGVTKQATALTISLLSCIIEEKNIHVVSSPRAAEMTKLLENTFRAVNIALVNELCLLCDRMGIDIWEVIEAASTKPFGFMPFYPGPGVGGHCIPVDPYYLSWKARQYDFSVKFIELAAEVNLSMPRYVIRKLQDILNSRLNKALSQSKVLILGVTFKPDIDDWRNSPALPIINLLRERKAKVFYHDPYVEKLELSDDYTLKREPLKEEILEDMDCVLIVTNHSSYDYEWIIKHSKLILDSRHATAPLNRDNSISKIVYI